MAKLSLFLLALGLAAAPLLAQSDVAIRATVYYDKKDGTRKATITDPEKGTSEETVTDSQGKVKSKATYLLDERGQAIGSISFDAKGQVMYRTSYKRDAMNRVDEESVTTADGRPLRRRVYTYGGSGQVTNIMEYDGNGVLVGGGRARSPMDAGQPTVRKATAVRR